MPDFAHLDTFECINPTGLLCLCDPFARKPVGFGAGDGEIAEPHPDLAQLVGSMNDPTVKRVARRPFKQFTHSATLPIRPSVALNVKGTESVKRNLRLTQVSWSELAHCPNRAPPGVEA